MNHIQDIPPGGDYPLVNPERPAPGFVEVSRGLACERCGALVPHLQEWWERHTIYHENQDEARLAQN